MHKCAAKCCDDTKSSATQVQSCVERCQKDIQSATDLIDNEMKQLQVLPLNDAARRLQVIYTGSTDALLA